MKISKPKKENKKKAVNLHISPKTFHMKQAPSLANTA